jgi:hypothetical protein
MDLCGFVSKDPATFDIFHALMKGAEIGSSNIILNNPLGFNRKLMKIALVSSQEKNNMGYLDDLGCCWLVNHLSLILSLVGGFNPSEKNIKVSWDDEIPNISQYIEK